MTCSPISASDLAYAKVRGWKYRMEQLNSAGEWEFYMWCTTRGPAQKRIERSNPYQSWRIVTAKGREVFRRIGEPDPYTRS